MPLHMRLPKLRGFKNPARVEYQVVNLAALEALFPEGGAVTVDDLVAKGAVRKDQPVKVLGQGDLGVALQVTVHAFSATAKEKIAAAGGTTTAALSRLQRVRLVVGAPRVATPLSGSIRLLAHVGPRTAIGPAASPRTGATWARSQPRRTFVLTAFARAFRTPDLRRKLLFTLGDPGALPARLVTCRRPASTTSPCETCLGQVENNRLYNLVNLFSGGALLQLSIFALGIMPYITASIIVQLLTVVIPRFEALKKEGQSGTAKLTQYTRYLTIGLAVLQSTGLVAIARSPGAAVPELHARRSCPNDSPFVLAVMVLTMTAGTAVIMWLGELITDRGIGNGMSLLIFTSIIARFPPQIWAIQQTKNSVDLRHGARASGWSSSPPWSSSSRRSAGSRCSTRSG